MFQWTGVVFYQTRQLYLPYTTNSENSMFTFNVLLLILNVCNISDYDVHPFSDEVTDLCSNVFLLFRNGPTQKKGSTMISVTVDSNIEMFY